MCLLLAFLFQLLITIPPLFSPIPSPSNVPTPQNQPRSLPAPYLVPTWSDPYQDPLNYSAPPPQVIKACFNQPQDVDTVLSTCMLHTIRKQLWVDKLCPSESRIAGASASSILVRMTMVGSQLVEEVDLRMNLTGATSFLNIKLHV